MNDEIKEINIKRAGQILDYVDTKEHLLELYNYITNLQQELEKRNTYIKYLEEYNPKYYKGEKLYGDGREDYKSRCEKAVELLKRYSDNESNYYVPVFELIDILNGKE